ncbi:hypothetical protein GALMADRAFT_768063 [Galerina marginata CBS 339.88]|uniref:Uncharacterized protein n=1 Tax=Galerina marginata (strain CBS 339.88) TaxID=685588 RepID=A0A067SZS6_GALM3|nr:hypothetical protein GALMADRAFT_768063 [Galerina marginata CBS 339.88]
MDIQRLTTIQAPPVDRLHNDILWHIFTLNTDVKGFQQSFNRPVRFQERHPISITRCSSQVCRKWRGVIVASPSIWASLIDLDVFNTRKDDRWMDEVMRRSGKSCLSVIGGRDPNTDWGRHPASRKFFISLLTNHWARVRNFDIVFKTSDFDASLWNVFWTTPSPHLEAFIFKNVVRASPFPPQFQSEGDVLFSNHAPLLRVFQGWSIRFDYRASWIGNLRDLTLTFILNVQEALDVLSQAPGLEKVALFPCEVNSAVHVPHHLPKVSLPRLQHIVIRGMVVEVATLLGRIIPAAICELEVHLGRSEGNTPEAQACFRNLVLLVFQFIDRSFKAMGVTECSVEVASSFFRCTVPRVGAADCAPFIIVFQTNSPIHLGLIFPARYSKAITSMIFIPRVEHPDPTRDTFLLSIVSVKTLVLSPLAVVHIEELSRENGLIWPLLNEVELRYLGPLDRRTQDNLVSFLLRRQRAGVPVVFDITNRGSIGRRKTNWALLDDVEGLKVIWKDSGAVLEYICGSGHPERLDFSSDSELY